MKKIIFLVRWPITDRDARRFGLEYLSGQGFDVRVFDLSALINEDALRRHAVAGALESPFIRRFGSYGELDAEIGRNAADGIFIDYLMGLAGIDLRTRKVFRLLKKHGAGYFVISGGALPVSIGPGTAAGLLRHLHGRIRKAADPDRLLNFFGRRAIRLLTNYASIYQLPEKIFTGRNEALEVFLSKHRVGRDRLVPIHSLDYDAYLEYTRGGGAAASEKTCVFLDEAATHHPDFAILGIEPLASDVLYYPAMNRLFDLIESRTGLRVVVAAHPRSSYDRTPGVFGDREVVRGRTIELVAGSSMVVTHASTSVSFAVLFDKPLMLVKTSEMIKNGHSGTIDQMAGALGTEAVNIDDAGALEALDFDYEALRGSRYEEYKYRYVKSRDADELTVWEIVARELRKTAHRPA